METLTFLAQRLREPSTSAGIAVAFQVLGRNVDPGIVQGLADFASLMLGALAMLLKERAK
jgi:hypothetical protein